MHTRGVPFARFVHASLSHGRRWLCKLVRMRNRVRVVAARFSGNRKSFLGKSGMWWSAIVHHGPTVGVAMGGWSMAALAWDRDAGSVAPSGRAATGPGGPLWEPRGPAWFRSLGADPCPRARACGADAPAAPGGTRFCFR